ncbi:MAG TPA: hypothetical protein DDX39_12080 [Bacteroidales bacterium]|nr:MAG: hypothetical protein A2W98_11485 [Bacteroidetes bacterium GWF2_33_38]OFY74857.1 MAG: hypothetical protein A2265_04060 [Bacteroidetes bacterium RIFOXYA12_FULL_33_9]OFY92063.1 MAG: hypothetical protein A2236_08895 [Bacteroidetes bacterium RIFOXYA2_FULL_33_7]HBF89370.1 hypothetical protein [Bacteroidales bacterium]
MGELIEKYDPEKIELIRMKLEQSAKSGSPEFFEIIVDDMPVVKRTNDLALFDSFRAYLAKGLNKISFRLYGTSSKGWRNIHRTFVMNTPQSNDALSGIDIDARINEKLRQERERWETELLKKELDETKEQLKEAEDYIEQLEDKIEEVRNEKNSVANTLGELGTGFFTGLIKRGSKKNPSLKTLAGFFDDDETASTTAEETETSFEKVSDENNGNENDPYVQILRQIEERLNKEQLTYVMGILGKMLDEPENIMPVAELLNLNK